MNEQQEDRITITDELCEGLADWKYLIQHLASHPTHVQQLCTQPAHFIGYSNACKLGAGGVLCRGTKSLYPVVWQLRWTPDIINRVKSSNNPDGDLSINDLELAGLVLNWLVLESLGVNLQHAHVALFCDNSSAVSWSYKLRTSTSIVAGKLLRLLGLRIHTAQASNITPLSIPGKENDMADICVQGWEVLSCC